MKYSTQNQEWIDFGNVKPEWNNNCFEVAINPNTSTILTECNGRIYRSLSGGPLLHLATANSRIHNFAFGFNDSIFIGGTFTWVNGTNANKIAFWNGSSSDWMALGSGCSGNGVYALAFYGKQNTLFVGGDFTSCDAVLAPHKLAKYVNGNWDTMPGGISANSIYSLTIDFQRGFLYASGYLSPNNVARFVIGNSTWQSIGFFTTIVNQAIISVAVDNLGGVYVSGKVIINNGASVVNVAYNLNGTWTALSNGVRFLFSFFFFFCYFTLIYLFIFFQVDSVPYKIAFDPVQNLLYAGGSFGYAGNTCVSNVAVW